MFEHSIAVPEYEEAVIGVALRDAEARDRTSSLSAQDFTHEGRKAIWSAIQQLHARGDDVDVLTVMETLVRWQSLDKAGGQEYLEDLAHRGGFNVESARTYAERLQRATLGRLTLGVGRDLGLLANEALNQTQEAYRAAYNELVQAGLPPANLSIAKTVAEGIAELFDLMANPLDLGVPMRIKYDNIREAGGMAAMMYPGMVSAVVGGSGEGKTAWMTKVAEDAASAGAHIVIVDGEIPHNLASARRLQRYSGVAAHKQIEQMYVPEPILSDVEWAQLAKARDEITSWTPNIHYLYAPGLSMWTILDELRELHRQWPINLAVLDYIQLFQCGDPERNEAQNISWAVQLFKNFCGQTNAHGYIGSQFSNEAVKSSNPRTQYGAKGSGDIGAKSNMVLTIQRPVVSEYEVRFLEPGERKVGINPGEMDILATFRVDKNSFGRSGVVTQMIFDGDYYVWRDYDARRAAA